VDQFWPKVGCGQCIGLRLIGKCVVDFLIVLIELRCYGWCTTSEYRFKIGDFAPTGAGWPKITGRRGHPPNHSSSQKTRLNDLSNGIKIWKDLSSVLSQCTRLTDEQTDRRTDSFLIARPRLHSMQRGKIDKCWEVEEDISGYQTKRASQEYMEKISVGKLWTVCVRYSCRKTEAAAAISAAPVAF